MTHAYETLVYQVGVLDLTVTTYVPDGFAVYNGSATISGVFDTVIGGNTNQTVRGGSGAATVVSGNGNDVIQLGGGLNTIVLGNGNDTIYAGNSVGTAQFGGDNISVKFAAFSVSLTGLSAPSFNSDNIGVFNGGTGNIGAFNGLFDGGSQDGSCNVGAFNGNLDGNGNVDSSSGTNDGNQNIGSLNGNLDGNFNTTSVNGNTNGNANAGSLNGNLNGNGSALVAAKPVCGGATYCGTMNTVDVGNGNDTIYAGNGLNTVVMGNGRDNVLFAGSFNTVVGGNGNDVVIGQNGGHNVVSLGTGISFIALDGPDNTVVLNGHGLDHIADWSICGGDVLDVSKALATTSWDGRSCDVSNFLHVTQQGCDSWVSVGSGRSCCNVADLVGTRTTLSSLMTQHGIIL